MRSVLVLAVSIANAENRKVSVYFEIFFYLPSLFIDKIEL